MSQSAPRRIQEGYVVLKLKKKFERLISIKIKINMAALKVERKGKRKSEMD